MKLRKPLRREFYERDTVEVAKELLGKSLVRRTCSEDIVARIVEVEAYKGENDPASHAYKGTTARNELMFGLPGFAYVYFVYGNHYCLNVTTEHEGIPGAVLIRAVEVLEGKEMAYKHRKPKSPTELSNGPGKLTKALNITKIHNGIDLTSSDNLSICEPEIVETLRIAASKRIGIKKGVDKKWRFYMKDNPFVSKSRLSKLSDD